MPIIVAKVVRVVGRAEESGGGLRGGDSEKYGGALRTQEVHREERQRASDLGVEEAVMGDSDAEIAPEEVPVGAIRQTGQSKTQSRARRVSFA